MAIFRRDIPKIGGPSPIETRMRYVELSRFQWPIASRRPMWPVMMIYQTAPLSNDREQPLTQFSRSCHYLTVNMSETVRDRYTVKHNWIKINRDLHLPRVISNDLDSSDLSEIFNDTKHCAVSLRQLTLFVCLVFCGRQLAANQLLSTFRIVFKAYYFVYV